MNLSLWDSLYHTPEKMRVLQVCSKGVGNMEDFRWQRQDLQKAHLKTLMVNHQWKLFDFSSPAKKVWRNLSEQWINIINQDKVYVAGGAIKEDDDELDQESYNLEGLDQQ